MFTCSLCRFETELDDAVVTHGGRCICLRCYDREVGREPPHVRKDIILAIEGMVPQ